MESYPKWSIHVRQPECKIPKKRWNGQILQTKVIKNYQHIGRAEDRNFECPIVGREIDRPMDTKEKIAPLSVLRAGHRDTGIFTLNIIVHAVYICAFS